MKKTKPVLLTLFWILSIVIVNIARYYQKTVKDINLLSDYMGCIVMVGIIYTSIGGFPMILSWTNYFDKKALKKK